MRRKVKVQLWMLLTTLNNKTANKISMNFKFYSTNVNKHYRIDPSESHHSSAILHFSMINAENLFQFQRELASTGGTSIIFRKERASIEKSDRNSAHGRDYSCFTLYSSVMNKKYAISHPNTGVYALYQSNNGSLGMAEPRLHDPRQCAREFRACDKISRSDTRNRKTDFNALSNRPSKVCYWK